MKNLLLPLVLVLSWSLQLMAAENVRLRTDTELVMVGNTNGIVQLNVEEPGGDATAETAPARVYVPINNTTTNSSQYYIGSVQGFPRVLDTTVDADKIIFPLTVSTPSSDRYLHIAVKDKDNSNNFRVVTVLPNGPLSQGADNFIIEFPVSPKEICARLSNQCQLLEPGSSTETEVKLIVYFFLSSQSIYSPGDVVDVANAPLNNGIYFEVNMSNRVYTAQDLVISIDKIRAGHQRLIIEYTSTGAIASGTAKSVRVFSHSSTPPYINAPIGSVPPYEGSLLSKEFDYAINGELTVTGLENKKEYNLSLLFVDKYLFGTTLSDDRNGSPKEIEELLKKQACFLLTAGFGEEHYVISYFRHFRDTFLAHTFLGKKFINFYYELAPKYALQLYQHDSLRALVRGVGYTLYFVFNYALSIAFALGLSILFIYLYKKREKIKI